jgi:hypothetical protein
LEGGWVSRRIQFKTAAQPRSRTGASANRPLFQDIDVTTTYETGTPGVDRDAGIRVGLRFAFYLV